MKISGWPLLGAVVDLKAGIINRAEIRTVE
jgi:hypothetical protein